MFAVLYLFCFVFRFVLFLFLVIIIFTCKWVKLLFFFLLLLLLLLLFLNPHSAFLEVKWCVPYNEININHLPLLNCRPLSDLDDFRVPCIHKKSYLDSSNARGFPQYPIATGTSLSISSILRPCFSFGTGKIKRDGEVNLDKMKH